MVHDALLWLKMNNPHYAEIDVSAVVLDELPVDDIPRELTDVIWQTTNVGVLAAENDSYVPEEGRWTINQALHTIWQTVVDELEDNGLEVLSDERMEMESGDDSE